MAIRGILIYVPESKITSLKARTKLSKTILQPLCIIRVEEAALWNILRLSNIILLQVFPVLEFKFHWLSPGVLQVESSTTNFLIQKEQGDLGPLEVSRGLPTKHCLSIKVLHFLRHKAGYKFCCSLSLPTHWLSAWYACWIVTIFSYCFAPLLLGHDSSKIWRFGKWRKQEESTMLKMQSSTEAAK